VNRQGTIIVSLLKASRQGARQLNVATQVPDYMSTPIQERQLGAELHGKKQQNVRYLLSTAIAQ
jgi:hypothetical protein